MYVQVYWEKKKGTNLDTSKITDNKMFWKTIKPMFSNKNKSRESITLVNNDEVLSDSQTIADVFNKFLQI